ncbi:MAG: hydrogenase maturation protease [Gemmatimonadaceae bacterium]
MARTLIAGFGNSLRGDDGFGVEVVRRLAARGTGSAEVELMEVGTGGIRLAQELLSPCDFLIIADAMTRGGTPGTLYVLEVESVEKVSEVDIHLALPSRALSVAQALGVLPPRIVLVGCEPLIVDELTCAPGGQLSRPVQAAVESAVTSIEELVRATTKRDSALETPSSRSSPVLTETS